MKQRLTDFINIGNRKDYSGSLQRSIILTNAAALGGAVFNLGYSLISLWFNSSVFYPIVVINLLTMFLFLPVFLLDKKKYFVTASVWLILCASLPILISLRLYLGYRSGAHFFFILLSLLPILIIPRSKPILMFLLSGLELIFFFLTYRYIPTNALVYALPKNVLPLLETTTAFMILGMVVLIFYINQRIIDVFEKDLTDKRKSLEMALIDVRKFASVDALTEIMNRGHMEQRINEELARGYRYGFPISLVMFDIDHFKNVNDAYGHDAGDFVLKKTAGIVKASIRETDTLGRWGGEEFMVLLPYTNEMIADKVAKKLCRIIEDTEHDDYGSITASFGVAQWDGIESFEKLYKRLDTALYAAKDNGRNQVVTDMLKQDAKQKEIKHDWRPDWESGNNEIDRQHRQLIDSLNALLHGDTVSKEPDFLDLLIFDVAAHFEYEEVLLVKIGYPEAESHKSLHKKLLKWLKSLRNEHAERGDYPPQSIHILEETIVTHMLEEDVKFFPYLK